MEEKNDLRARVEEDKNLVIVDDDTEARTLSPGGRGHCNVPFLVHLQFRGEDLGPVILQRFGVEQSCRVVGLRKPGPSPPEEEGTAMFRRSST